MPLPDLQHMSRIPIIIAGFLLFGSSALLRLNAQNAEPMLPDWDEAATKLPTDTLAPAAGLLPDAGPEGEPVDLPPADSLPELPPLQGPSDGEPAPELPEVPGLVAPKKTTVPLNPAGQPAIPDPLANIQEAAHWHRSPREARSMAQKEGKPMLLVFGGFNWSPACQALNNDLFTNEQFNQYAATNLVLSFINVPTRSSFSSLGSNSTDNKAQQMEAIKAYRSFLKIRSLPTIILFDADGHEVDRMVGYNFNKALRLNSLAKAVSRIEISTKNLIAQRAKLEAKRKTLADLQNYRIWTTRTGKTLFAKLLGDMIVEAPTEKDEFATEKVAVLMDEDGKKKYIGLKLLTVSDAEIVRRTASSDQTVQSTEPPGYYKGLPVRTP